MAQVEGKVVRKEVVRIVTDLLARTERIRNCIKYLLPRHLKRYSLVRQTRRRAGLAKIPYRIVLEQLCRFCHDSMAHSGIDETISSTLAVALCAFADIGSTPSSYDSISNTDETRQPLKGQRELFTAASTVSEASGECH